jgi:hypothetical protein
MSKIMSHDGAAAALSTMMEQRKAADDDRAKQSEFRPGAGVPTDVD